MKNFLPCILIFALGLTSCEEQNSDTEQDFLLKIGDDLKFSYNDVKFYDSSTYMLYFKTNHPELKNHEKLSFSFYVGGEKIYQGSYWPPYMCSLPTGVFVYPFFYPDYVMKFEHSGIDEPDPRNDPRIINAFKKHNLLHSGISVEINSIKIDGSLLIFSFTVKNQDESDLLILDINKMGPNLFHYFTNGLVIYNLNYTSDVKISIEHQAPAVRNSWEISWLSKLKSGSSEQFMIHYTLDELPNQGEYNVFFVFPGLSHQVELVELFQDGSRIWLGDVRVDTKFIIH